MRNASLSARLPIALAMPRSMPPPRHKQRRTLPGHGAFAFPIDPDRSPRDDPALWDPAVAACIVIIDPGPDFPPPHALPGLRQIGQADDGTHAVLFAGGRTIRLWLRGPQRGLHHGPRTAFHLPDDPLFDGRLRATAQARLWLGGTGGSGTPPSDLSPFQAARLDLMLRLLDAHVAGATLRELAYLAYPAMPDLSAALWKASSERRGTHRLFTQALRLRDGGYHDLLRAG